MRSITHFDRPLRSAVSYNQHWLEQMYSRSSMRSPEKPSPKVADILEQLAHTADGVFAVDRHHRIILWNHAAESLLGYAAQEVLGRPCEDVIQGRDCNGQLTCGKQCSQFEEAKKLRWQPHQDVRARSKDGKEVRIDVTTLSVLSEQQELSTLVHIFRNAGGTDHAQSSWPAEQLEQPVSRLAFHPGPGSPNDGGKRKPSPLSSRELSVLRHLTEGMSTTAISESLFISPTTVRNHVQNILKKLQVHSRLEAIALAFHQRTV